MSSSSAYTLQLPYLGSIPLGKSPPNLTSFQKPLRELYIPYYRQRRDRHPDERRIIISDRDILIFEPDAASKGKRALIYSTLEAIVDIQALELYVMFNQTENHHHKRIRAAFLPIGCEHQERFRSLYSTIDKSQYNLLSLPTSIPTSHPPLVLFVIRKTGAGGTCSLLDCHVFAVRRESNAFELCDMIRKLIIKRTMSPILPTSSTSGKTLLRRQANDNQATMEKRTKYLDRDRPISAMEHRQADIQIVPERKSNRPGSTAYFHEMPQLATNGLTNPLLTSSSFILNPTQNPHHDPSKVLHTDSDAQHMSSPSNPSIRTLSTKQHHQQHQSQQQPRHFIKASSSSSSLVFDESDEVVNDLMNIVVAEKLKTTDTNSHQAPVKRHASFDQSSSPQSQHDYTMSKKRYQFHNHQQQQPQQQHHHHHKKRSYLINPSPLPTILSANNTPVISRTATNVEQTQPQPFSPLDNHLLRPQFVLHRYGDIGNYVPKLLRENVNATPATMRSSDSNENIFFRATNGHILNGFLNLDFSNTASTTPPINGNNNNNNNNNNQHYRSTPCLTDENANRNIFSLVRQLRKNQSKATGHQKDSLASNQKLHLEVNQSYHDGHQAPPCRIPRVILQSQQPKPAIAAMGGIKVLPFAPPPITYSSPHLQKASSLLKPKRIDSSMDAETGLPLDYKQYLRHTDQGDFLYGEEQQRQHARQQQPTLEHSLGYFP